MKNKSKVVNRTSVFPASKDKIFELLQGFDILCRITYPYITFKPVDGNTNIKWEKDKTYVFKAKVFGFIPFGTHQITLIEFNKDTRIYSNEKNTYVPVWNHEIILKEIDDSTTQYSDIVEIYAGWKTKIVYIWANRFYAHRQKKWIKILKSLPNN